MKVTVRGREMTIDYYGIREYCVVRRASIETVEKDWKVFYQLHILKSKLIISFSY